MEHERITKGALLDAMKVVSDTQVKLQEVTLVLAEMLAWYNEEEPDGNPKQ